MVLAVRRGFCMRLVLVGDLFLFLIFLVLFVTLPLFPSKEDGLIATNGLTREEIVIALFAIIPMTALFGRFFSKPRIPYNEWAYLLSAGYTLLVLAGFLTFGLRSVDVRPPALTLVVFFSLVGIFGAAGAHVVDGGGKPVGPLLERWLNERPTRQ